MIRLSISIDSTNRFFYKDMDQNLTMQDLVTKLSKLGFSEGYIRDNGLPSWWDKELDTKPFAVLEGAGYIADRFNIDPQSLLDKTRPVRFNKFYSSNVQDKSLDTACALAVRIGELIGYGLDGEIKDFSLPTNPENIRNEILKTRSKVDLIALLRYCWSKGIAVAYFSKLPESKLVKSIDGLIYQYHSNPIILLNCHYTSAVYLTFHLAHLLGHIALGHHQNEVFIDEIINITSEEQQEEPANNFASSLLVNIYSEGRVTIEGQSKDISLYLADEIDWNKFSDESYEYLEKSLGLS